jgi:hypothetical protein
VGKLFDALDGRLRTFITAQHLFFVSTAPSGDDGHVNCSPKGLDTFRILDATTVAYLDYVGSGAETIAHLRQNGRIVIMFCALEGAPMILRLHGRGTAVEPQDAELAELLRHFDGVDTKALRSIIRVELTRISDSCGYGVPRYRFEKERDQLTLWAERKGAEGIETYQRTKNAKSIDGLDALRWVGGSD